MKKIFTILLLLVTSFAMVGVAQAHDGRNLDVVVVDGKIFAQGFNSDTFDQADFVRPYQNAIHGHFDGNGISTFPSFAVTGDNFLAHSNGTTYQYGYQNDAADLVGFDLEIELVNAGKVINPVLGSLNLTNFDATDRISVGFGNNSLSTDDIGTAAASFDLVNDWTAPTSDLDFSYFTANNPSDELFFLEWEIRSDNPLIENSDAIYTLFAPPQALHPEVLALEAQVSVNVTAVPEPGSMTILGFGMLMLGLRRRRSGGNQVKR